MPDSERLRPIILGPGEGRAYALGAMSAVFKADEAETAATYSISEWFLEPHSSGPGPHSHADHDDIFYVIEGVMSLLVGDDWVDAGVGSFVRAPAGVTHDFANRTVFHPCRMEWEQACIDPDGTVHPVDYSRPPIGNLLHTSLAEMWNGPDMASLRRAALQRTPKRLRTSCPLT